MDGNYLKLVAALIRINRTSLRGTTFLVRFNKVYTHIIRAEHRRTSHFNIRNVDETRIFLGK